MQGPGSYQSIARPPPAPVDKGFTSTPASSHRVHWRSILNQVLLKMASARGLADRTAMASALAVVTNDGLIRSTPRQILRDFWASMQVQTCTATSRGSLNSSTMIELPKWLVLTKLPS